MKFRHLLVGCTLALVGCDSTDTTSPAIVASGSLSFSYTGAGQANATKLVFEAIHEGNATPDVLAIKYFEALGTIANGQSTKIIVPTEMAGIAGSVAGLAEVLGTMNGRDAK